MTEKQIFVMWFNNILDHFTSAQTKIEYLQIVNVLFALYPDFEALRDKGEFTEREAADFDEKFQQYFEKAV